MSVDQDDSGLGSGHIDTSSPAVPNHCPMVIDGQSPQWSVEIWVRSEVGGHDANDGS